MSVVVTGATGFIGRHLIKHLSENGTQVRALTRRIPPTQLSLPGVHWVIGDLADPNAWQQLLEPGCTVFNLAYSASTVPSGAVQAAGQMVECCAAGRISRLVHCSTVSVYGRIEDSIVTEKTACRPANAYGQVKLDIERILVEKVANRFECAVLRPSNVFGDGSIALQKLIRNLRDGSRLVSYLRASLFGTRRAHLVPIETVVFALMHLSRATLTEAGELFIVSDDDDPINNVRDVERIVREELRIPGFPIPPLAVPRMVLEALLRAMRRPNLNTQTIYSPAKLKSRGFETPVSLEQALRSFIRDLEPSWAGAEAT